MTTLTKTGTWLALFLLMASLPALAGPIHDAASAGDAAKVTSLLEGDAALRDSHDDKGYTPLMCALNHAKLDVADLLLKRGADVTVIGGDGATALMVASTQDAAGIVQTLLDKGADVKAADKDGWTALHYAGTMGQAAVVRLLLAHGADPTIKEAKGRTPQDLALIGKHPDVAALLAPSVPAPDTNPFAQMGKDLDNFMRSSDAKTLTIDGLEYSTDGGFARKILDMNTAIAKTPNNPDLYMARGLAYTQVPETIFGKVNSVGNMTAASADFTKAIALDPKRADAYLARAGTYGDLCMTLADGGFPKAMADADKAVAVAPDAPASWVGRGNVRLAAVDATQAVVLSFDTKGMAVIQAAAGLALADFEKALVLDPQTKGAYRGRGIARLQAGGDAALVQADLIQAVTENPGDADALVRLTNVASSRADWPAARKAADALLALRPDTSEYYAARSQIRVQQSDLDGALADAGRAVDLNTPKGGEPLAAALLVRGGILTALKKYDLAETDEHKATGIDPNNEDAWDALARLQADEGRLDDATASLRGGLMPLPNSSKLHLTLGLMLALKEDVPGARMEYAAGLAYASPDAVAAQTTLVQSILKARPDSAGLKAALTALQANAAKH